MRDDQRIQVLRMKCQWCGASKHALQYVGERRVDGVLTYDKPGVCLACPKCDSPSVDAAKK